MSRRINSFGYRLGVTHFWKFQRSLNYSIHSLLSTSNLHQIIFTLFSFYGYTVLLCSSSFVFKKLFISVYLLKNHFFDLKKINFFYKSKNNINFYLFEFLLKLKKLFDYLFVYIYVFFKFLNVFKLNFLFFFYFNLFFNCLLIFFNKLLNLVNINFFNYLKKVIKLKKNIYSSYFLNAITKKIEYFLYTLIPKKKLKLKSNSVYNLFPYNRKKVENLYFRNFWVIKRNFKFFEIVYFSCFFSLSSVIVNIIVLNLSRKKKTHFRFINFFFFFIEFLFFQGLLPISGIKLLLFGKLNAKMRKQKVILFLGKLWLSTILSQVSFNQQDHETRFGVLGIRVWLCKSLLKS